MLRAMVMVIVTSLHQIIILQWLTVHLRIIGMVIALLTAESEGWT